MSYEQDQYRSPIVINAMLSGFKTGTGFAFVTAVSSFLSKKGLKPDLDYNGWQMLS